MAYHSTVRGEAPSAARAALGEFYGQPYPDTGRSPTHEEWNVATTTGKPIVVFTKRGVAPEPAQTAFMKEVEDYRWGVFRKSFDDAPDLLNKLADALEEAAVTRRPLVWRRLPQPVSVPWREQRSTSWSSEGTVLEVHLLPVGSASLLPASALGQLSRRLARVGREHGLFDESRGVDLTETESAATAIAKANGRTPEATLRVARDRAISVTMSLPPGVMEGPRDDIPVEEIDALIRSARSSGGHAGVDTSSGTQPRRRRGCPDLL